MHTPETGLPQGYSVQQQISMTLTAVQSGLPKEKFLHNFGMSYPEGLRLYKGKLKLAVGTLSRRQDVSTTQAIHSSGPIDTMPAEVLHKSSLQESSCRILCVDRWLQHLH
jgi:hypothetical protein